jgi:mitotic spindle assembly checkpoint protein MAD2
MSSEIAAIVRQARHPLRGRWCRRLTRLRQITASVTFLPLLDEPCAHRASVACRSAHPGAGTFDLLVYTDAASATPSEWCDADEFRRPCRPAHPLPREESDPRLVSGAESVRLRSFSTRVHKVETCVAYKGADEDAL